MTIDKNKESRERAERAIKILAPLSSPDDARTLPRLGADELYFSLQLPGARISTSRRELHAANFNGFDDVELCVEIAHGRGARVILALNKTFYTNSELKTAMETLRACLELGVDGVIAADVGLLISLHREGIHKRTDVILSTVAAPTNASAIRVFADLGVSRVILPRNASPADAARYVRRFPGLEFEALIFNWHCMNLDGVCRFQHEIPNYKSCPDVALNGCSLEFSVSSPTGHPTEEIERVFSNVYSRSETGCGACSIWDFADAGVRYFKVVGRLLDVGSKERSVRFIDGCRRIFYETDDRSRYVSLTRRYYENTFGKKCDGVCYYKIRDTT